MGTLERIRQTSPYFLAAFAVIFIAFFVISDMDPNTVFRSKGLKNEDIAIVNGEKLSYAEFETKAREIEEQQREAARNNPEAQQQEPDGSQLRLQLFNQLVDQKLLAQESKKAGAEVSNGAVLDIMLENPPKEVQQMFADSTGKFDRALYQMLVTNPETAYKGLPAQERQERLKAFRDYFKQIQENVEMQLMYNNIQTLVVTSGSVVSPLYAQEVIASDSSIANVSYIAFDVNSVKDDEVKVSDDEISKYYEAHKQYYNQKDQRKIKYAIFPIVASKADSADAEKKVKRIYESLQTAKQMDKVDSVFKARVRENTSEVVEYTAINQLHPRISAVLNTIPEGDFVGPIPQPQGYTFYYLEGKRNTNNEEVKASHILIKFGKDKAAAKAKIEEINAELKSGEDFAELAKKYSQDGSAQNGGDLGFFKKGQMVKEFEEAAFKAKENEVVGPVETMFGYHLIKVAEKKSENVDEVKYSEITIKPIISKMAKKQLMRNANEIVRLVSEGGQNFDSAVAKHSTTKAMETPFLTKDRMIPGFTSPYAVLKAFEMEQGKVIEPWEDKNLGYIVAQVSGVRKAGTASLEDKKEEIKAILMRNKKLDLLKSKAEAAFAQIQAKGGSLSDLIADTTLGIKVVDSLKNNGSIANFGRDFAFTQKAFMNPLNQIQLVRGERAYYIMQVNNRVDFKAPEFAQLTPDKLVPIMMQGAQNAFTMWYSKVREDANIEDHRLKIWDTNF
jgi:peptidylprolyl isomerase/peptidyl-prolyl cis-trans isomerase D